MAAEQKREGSNALFRRLMERSGLQSQERSGFVGRMSDEINGWQRKGIGKAIGFPFFDGGFRGVFFALPLTDREKPDDPSQRVLLLAPVGDQCHFAILAPKVSNASPKEVQEVENIQTAKVFHEVFSPSTEPLILRKWIPHMANNPFNEFFIDPSLVDPSITVTVVLSEEEKGPFLKKALENVARIAERKAERERVNRLQVDEISLRKVVPDIIDDLDLLDQALLRGSERRERLAEEVGELLEGVEKDLIVDLEENFDSSGGQHGNDNS